MDGVKTMGPVRRTRRQIIRQAGMETSMKLSRNKWGKEGRQAGR